MRYSDGTYETFSVGHSELMVGPDSQHGVTRKMVKEAAKPGQSRSVDLFKNPDSTRAAIEAEKRFKWLDTASVSLSAPRNRTLACSKPPFV